MVSAEEVTNGGLNWLHQIKFDGYRLRMERNGDRVRLISEADTTEPGGIPALSRSAPRNRMQPFVIEAIVRGVDGNPLGTSV